MPNPFPCSKETSIKDINGNLTHLKVGCWYKIVNVENNSILKAINETRENDLISLNSSKNNSNLILSTELFSFIPIENDGYIIKNLCTKKVVTPVKNKNSYTAELMYDNGCFINDQVINLVPHNNYKKSYIIKQKKLNLELDVFDAYYNRESYQVVFRNQDSKYITHVLYNFVDPMPYFSSYKYTG